MRGSSPTAARMKRVLGTVGSLSISSGGTGNTCCEMGTEILNTRTIALAANRDAPPYRTAPRQDGSMSKRLYLFMAFSFGYRSRAWVTPGFCCGRRPQAVFSDAPAGRSAPTASPYFFTAVGIHQSPRMALRIIITRNPNPRPIRRPAATLSTSRPTPMPIRRPAGMATPVTPPVFLGCCGRSVMTGSLAVGMQWTSRRAPDRPSDHLRILLALN